MLIIDAQLHEPPVALDWPPLDRATKLRVLHELQIAYMDAVGVDRAVLFPSDLGWAEELAALVPERFAVVAAFAPGGGLKGFAPSGVTSGPDPLADDIEDQLERQLAKPWMLGFRMMDVRAFADVAAGRTARQIYARALTACEAAGTAVFMSSAGDTATPRELATAYPKLTLVIDHLGIRQPPMYERDQPAFATLAALLALADVPNIALKFSGVPTLALEPYPYPDLWPSLRAIIDAFGPHRLMWGSDISRVDGRIGFDVRFTEALAPYHGKHNYGQALHYLLDSDQVTETEKTWILGRTAQQLLRWP
jgi:L-fuconolactonase